MSSESEGDFSVEDWDKGDDSGHSGYDINTRIHQQYEASGITMMDFDEMEGEMSDDRSGDDEGEEVLDEITEEEYYDEDDLLDEEIIELSDDDFIEEEIIEEVEEVEEDLSDEQYLASLQSSFEALAKQRSASSADSSSGAVVEETTEPLAAPASPGTKQQPEQQTQSKKQEDDTVTPPESPKQQQQQRTTLQLPSQQENRGLTSPKSKSSHTHPSFSMDGSASVEFDLGSNKSFSSVESPENYEEACRELIRVVHKGQNVDVDDMLSRCELKSFYAHLKQQHKHLLREQQKEDQKQDYDASSPKDDDDDEEDADTEAGNQNSNWESFGDGGNGNDGSPMFAGGPFGVEATIADTTTDSKISTSAFPSNNDYDGDDDVMWEDDPFGHSNSGAANVDGVAGPAWQDDPMGSTDPWGFNGPPKPATINDLNETFPSDDAFATTNDEPTTASIEETKDEYTNIKEEQRKEKEEPKIVLWEDRNKGDPDPENFEDACYNLYAVIYKDDEECDIQTSLSRSSPRDLYYHLKQQYWYMVHSGQLEEKALENYVNGLDKQQLVEHEIPLSPSQSPQRRPSPKRQSSVSCLENLSAHLAKRVSGSFHGSSLGTDSAHRKSQLVLDSSSSSEDDEEDDEDIAEIYEESENNDADGHVPEQERNGSSQPAQETLVQVPTDELDQEFMNEDEASDDDDDHGEPADVAPYLIQEAGPSFDEVGKESIDDDKSSALHKSDHDSMTDAVGIDEDIDVQESSDISPDPIQEQPSLDEGNQELIRDDNFPTHLPDQDFVGDDGIHDDVQVQIEDATKVAPDPSDEQPLTDEIDQDYMQEERPQPDELDQDLIDDGNVDKDVEAQAKSNESIEYSEKEPPAPLQGDNEDQESMHEDEAPPPDALDEDIMDDEVGDDDIHTADDDIHTEDTVAFTKEKPHEEYQESMDDDDSMPQSSSHKGIESMDDDNSMSQGADKDGTHPQNEVRISSTPAHEHLPMPPSCDEEDQASRDEEHLPMPPSCDEEDHESSDEEDLPMPPSYDDDDEVSMEDSESLSQRGGDNSIKHAQEPNSLSSDPAVLSPAPSLCDKEDQEVTRTSVDQSRIETLPTPTEEEDLVDGDNENATCESAKLNLDPDKGSISPSADTDSAISSNKRSGDDSADHDDAENKRRKQSNDNSESSQQAYQERNIDAKGDDAEGVSTLDVSNGESSQSGNEQINQSDTIPASDSLGGNKGEPVTKQGTEMQEPALPILSDTEKTTILLKEELDMLLAETQKELEHPMEPEAVEAVKLAARKVSYTMKFYDVLEDKFVYLPSVTKTIIDYTLTDEAENFYFDEDEEFPIEYTSALRHIAALHFQHDTLDYETIGKLAVAVDKKEEYEAPDQISTRPGDPEGPDKADQDEERKRVQGMIQEEIDVLIDEAEEHELEEPLEPEAVSALVVAAMKVGYTKKYFDEDHSKFVYFPSISKCLMNYTLTEEAEKHYSHDGMEDFPVEYTAALREVALKHVESDDLDYENIERLAQNVFPEREQLSFKDGKAWAAIETLPGNARDVGETDESHPRSNDNFFNRSNGLHDEQNEEAESLLLRPAKSAEDEAEQARLKEMAQILEFKRRVDKQKLSEDAKLLGDMVRQAEEKMSAEMQRIEDERRSAELKLAEEASLLETKYEDDKAALDDEFHELEVSWTIGRGRLEKEAEELEKRRQEEEDRIENEGRKMEEKRLSDSALSSQQYQTLRGRLATAKSNLEAEKMRFANEERTEKQTEGSEETKGGGFFGRFGRNKGASLEKEKEKQTKLMQQKIKEMELEKEVQDLESELESTKEAARRIELDRAEQQSRLDSEARSLEQNMFAAEEELAKETKEFNDVHIESKSRLEAKRRVLEETHADDQAWIHREKVALLEKMKQAREDLANEAKKQRDLQVQQEAKISQTAIALKEKWLKEEATLAREIEVFESSQKIRLEDDVETSIERLKNVGSENMDSDGVGEEPKEEESRPNAWEEYIAEYDKFSESTSRDDEVIEEDSASQTSADTEIGMEETSADAEMEVEEEIATASHAVEPAVSEEYHAPEQEAGATKEQTESHSTESSGIDPTTGASAGVAGENLETVDIPETEAIAPTVQPCGPGVEETEPEQDHEVSAIDELELELPAEEKCRAQKPTAKMKSEESKSDIAEELRPTAHPSELETTAGEEGPSGARTEETKITENEAAYQTRQSGDYENETKADDAKIQMGHGLIENACEHGSPDGIDKENYTDMDTRSMGDTDEEQWSMFVEDKPVQERGMDQDSELVHIGDKCSAKANDDFSRSVPDHLLSVHQPHAGDGDIGSLEEADVFDAPAPSTPKKPMVTAALRAKEQIMEGNSASFVDLDRVHGSSMDDTCEELSRTVPEHLMSVHKPNIGDNDGASLDDADVFDPPTTTPPKKPLVAAALKAREQIIERQSKSISNLGMKDNDTNELFQEFSKSVSEGLVSIHHHPRHDFSDGATPLKTPIAAAPKEQEQHLTESRSTSSFDTSQNSDVLEHAIEAGDWEAVEKAATRLHDQVSTISADTNDIDRMAEGMSSDGSLDTRSTQGDTLDELVDNGDWAGVAEAASPSPKRQEKGSARGEKETEIQEQGREEVPTAHIEGRHFMPVQLISAKQPEQNDDGDGDSLNEADVFDPPVNRTEKEPMLAAALKAKEQMSKSLANLGSDQTEDAKDLYEELSRSVPEHLMSVHQPTDIDDIEAASLGEGDVFDPPAAKPPKRPLVFAALKAKEQMMEMQSKSDANLGGTQDANEWIEELSKSLPEHLVSIHQPIDDEEIDGASLGQADVFDPPRPPAPKNPILAAALKAKEQLTERQSKSVSNLGSSGDGDMQALYEEFSRSVPEHLMAINQPVTTDEDEENGSLDEANVFDPPAPSTPKKPLLAAALKAKSQMAERLSKSVVGFSGAHDNEIKPSGDDWSKSVPEGLVMTKEKVNEETVGSAPGHVKFEREATLLETPIIMSSIETKGQTLAERNSQSLPDLQLSGNLGSDPSQEDDFSRSDSRLASGGDISDQSASRRRKKGVGLGHRLLLEAKQLSLSGSVRSLNDAVLPSRTVSEDKVLASHALSASERGPAGLTNERMTHYNLNAGEEQVSTGSKEQTSRGMDPGTKATQPETAVEEKNTDSGGSKIPQMREALRPLDKGRQSSSEGPPQTTIDGGSETPTRASPDTVVEIVESVKSVKEARLSLERRVQKQSKGENEARTLDATGSSRAAQWAKEATQDGDEIQSQGREASVKSVKDACLPLERRSQGKAASRNVDSATTSGVALEFEGQPPINTEKSEDQSLLTDDYLKWWRQNGKRLVDEKRNIHEITGSDQGDARYASENSAMLELQSATRNQDLDQESVSASLLDKRKRAADARERALQVRNGNDMSHSLGDRDPLSPTSKKKMLAEKRRQVIEARKKSATETRNASDPVSSSQNEDPKISSSQDLDSVTTGGTTVVASGRSGRTSPDASTTSGTTEGKAASFGRVALLAGRMDSTSLEERRRKRLEESERLAERTARARRSRLARENGLSISTRQASNDTTEADLSLRNIQSGMSSPSSSARKTISPSSAQSSLMPHMVREADRLAGFICRYEQKLETLSKSILSVAQQHENDDEAGAAASLPLQEMYGFVRSREWYKKHAAGDSRPSMLFAGLKAEADLAQSKREQALQTPTKSSPNSQTSCGDDGSGKVYKVTSTGEAFLKMDGPMEADVCRFLTSVHNYGEGITKSSLEKNWEDIARLSGDVQSARVRDKLQELIGFCLDAHFME